MNLLGVSGTEIIDSVRNFFQEVGSELAGLWFWPIIFIGLMVAAIITMIFLVRLSYENRILKSVNKLNKYFLAKPFINEDNLVEFNLKMKSVPKVLRNNWQVYMLNREDEPTTYINVNTCIDKPLRTSSIEKNMGNFTIFTVFLAFLSFVIGVQYVSSVLNNTNLGDILFISSLVPLCIVVLYTIFYLLIKASKNDIYSCLYENFPLFERNLTKAVTTLPAYVDYEILFTKQEIQEGIPILQQYLEKRALVEEEEMEKARENSVATEEYDFSELGIDGSLVLERSMKECETFIKVRKRLQDESDAIEAEKENYKKTFETTSKDMQRKLQASRENLDSLRTQQEESTNRIESNYIRKQQADEIKKQQQLEKDIEEATAKFEEEQETLQSEIEKRGQEIEEKRQFVEQAMLLEFKHYANSLYNALTNKAQEIGNQKLVALAQENSDLKALLTDIHGVGTSEEQLNPENNLIQQNEITSENLYDMSSSDEETMSENRSISKEMEKEENKKIKEKIQQEKIDAAGQEAIAPQITEQMLSQEIQNDLLKSVAGDVNASAEQVVEQPTDNIVQPDVITQTVEQPVDSNVQSEAVAQAVESEEQGQVAPQAVESNEQPQEETMEQGVKEEVEQPQETNNVSNGNDDGGQQMVASEDLANIQKQIDEESNRLQREKVELENDLNNTISKIDSKPVEESEGVDLSQTLEESNKYDSNYEEEPEEEYEDETVEESEEEPEEEPVRKRSRPASRESSARREAPVRKPASRRVRERDEEPRDDYYEDDEPERQTRRSVSRGSARTSRSSRVATKEPKNTTDLEIDELNAQMQRLLGGGDSSRPSRGGRTRRR